MASRITIQLVGSTPDKEDVRLNDFIEQLRGVKKSLAENERLASNGGEPVLDYKIVDLRHSSPSTVVLEPVYSAGPLPEYTPRVLRDFSEELRAIRSEGRLKREPDFDRLEAYQHLGYHPEGLIQKVRIIVDRKSVTIDQKFRTRLQDIIGPDEIIEGSISGMLEAVNFHNTNRFTIWPPIGPRKVSGVFPAPLRQDIKQAIGNFVTVTGKLKYKSWSPFPHGVVAQQIDIHQPDTSLPTLAEMRGSFAGLTGGLTSVEFVEKMRHENW